MATDFLADYLTGSPEARAAIDRARNEHAARRRQALAVALKRYEPSLLPGALAKILEQHPELGDGDAPRRAVAVHRFVTEDPRAHRYLKAGREPDVGPVVQFRRTSAGELVPEAPTPAPAAAKPRGDALRAALAPFAADFKTPALMEKFYDEHALEYAHAEPAEAVGFVARAMDDRKFKEYQKHEIPPDEATLRLVDALRPYDSQLKGRLLDIAESDRFVDLTGPNSPTEVRQLEAIVVTRLKSSSAKSLLVNGEFDPSQAVRPARPAVQAAEPQAARRAFPDVF